MTGVTVTGVTGVTEVTRSDEEITEKTALHDKNVGKEDINHLGRPK